MINFLVSILFSTLTNAWLGIAVALFYFSTKRQWPLLRNKYSQQHGILYHFKRCVAVALLAIISLTRRIWRRYCPNYETDADILNNPSVQGNLTAFYGNDKHGNAISICLCRHPIDKAEVLMRVRLSDGRLLSRDAVVQDETPRDDEFDSDVVGADGLRIRMIESLKTCRIIYAGLMRVQSEGEEKRFVEVNMRLWCRSLADPANRAVDFHPFLLAESFAVEAWSRKLIDDVTRSQRERDTFEQHSEFRGRLVIISSDATAEQLELAMHGIRYRVNGEVDHTRNDAYVSHRARFDNGFVLSLTASSVPTTLTHIVEGYLHLPNGYVCALSWSDFHLVQLPDNGNLAESYTFNFIAGGTTYSVAVSFVALDLNPVSINEKGVLYRNMAKFCLNGTAGGFGNVELWRAKDDHARAELLVSHHDVQRFDCPKTMDRSLCVALSEEAAAKTSLTGGKAAKLAALVSLNHSENEFEVPKGFTVTVEAYGRHVAKNTALQQGIDAILQLIVAINEACDETSAKQHHAKLERSCEELVKKFSETPIDGGVKEAIENFLEAMFENLNNSGVMLAVRSSAVGEDSAEASGAGQMETFLGVACKEEVIAAVTKCWGSHFAYRAVEYRRQMCAKLDSPMAVLIQQLVSADVAGVLFTRHPDTGSTARMMINASYGIGESVVSGTVDVDTITVFKLDETGDKLKISYDHVGEKATALKATEHGMVHEEALKTTLPHTKMDHPKYESCLTEEEIHRLVKVGKQIEGIFGAGRDVEFAICRNIAARPSIFILQSRPITTSDMEQEWELLQEFDTPMASDREWLTTANIQEMMPGALSPLSMHGWSNVVAVSTEVDQIQLFIKPHRRVPIGRSICLMSQHPFINYTMIAGQFPNQAAKDGTETAIFGKLLENLTIEEIFEQNDTCNKWFRWWFSSMQWLKRLFPYRQMEKLEGSILKAEAPSSTNLPEQFKQLAELLPLGLNASAAHLSVSAAPAIGSSIIMRILERDPLKWNETHYSDMAILLSSCNDVVSADVPTMLRAITASLAEPDERRHQFLAMDRKNAAKWMASQEKAGKSAVLFESFLKAHGHRCVREADLRETSWHMEPEKVVDAIQAMLKTKEGNVAQSNKKVTTVDEALDAIRTPISNFQKKLIQMLLPMVRRAVGRREWSKSLAMRTSDLRRRGFATLSEMLAKQGFIPDRDLMFFLSELEVGKLIQHRSPKLIAKAMRRRKLFPKLSDVQFEEIIQGYPKPIEAKNDLSAPSGRGDGVVLKGTPVGQGGISGRARVIKSLTEANSIKSGEILIVPYTDVGWTPYFPLIAGLVTELGGLISHGAVVAREYGLPCVVGCKQATQLISTGDFVTIDGRTGQVTANQPREQ